MHSGIKMTAVVAIWVFAAGCKRPCNPFGEKWGVCEGDTLRECRSLYRAGDNVLTVTNCGPGRCYTPPDGFARCMPSSPECNPATFQPSCRLKSEGEPVVVECHPFGENRAFEAETPDKACEGGAIRTCARAGPPGKARCPAGTRCDSVRIGDSYQVTCAPPEGTACSRPAPTGPPDARPATTGFCRDDGAWELCGGSAEDNRMLQLGLAPPGTRLAQRCSR